MQPISVSILTAMLQEQDFEERQLDEYCEEMYSNGNSSLTITKYHKNPTKDGSRESSLPINDLSSERIEFVSS